MPRVHSAVTGRTNDVASPRERLAAGRRWRALRGCLVVAVVLLGLGIVGCDNAPSRIGSGPTEQNEPPPDIVGTLRAAAGATLSAASAPSDAQPVVAQPARVSLTPRPAPGP